MYDIKNTSIWKKEPETKPDNGWMDIDVSALNLSVRSYNCLKRAGCSTVGEIISLIEDNDKGLRKIRNLGTRSETEILECIERMKKEYEQNTDAAGNPRKKKVLIRPAKKWMDTDIEYFHLSNEALFRLRKDGVRLVKDLYSSDLKQEPGWYAVRELFEKIPILQNR